MVILQPLFNLFLLNGWGRRKAAYKTTSQVGDVGSCLLHGYQ